MRTNYTSAKIILAHMLAGILMLLQSSSVYSQAPVLTFNLVSSGLSSPVDVVTPPDGSNRLFVVEKTGKIRIISGGILLQDPFIDLSSLLPPNAAQSEQGLLSVAFHPQYATNKFFFVYYVNTAGDIEIARYQASADPLVALANSGQVLLTIPHPGQGNHNGGKLNFGSDGNLYFATGDGGGAGDQPNNAQNGQSLLGKMLRINVDNFAVSSPFYTIPADNPFIGNPAIADEIWALGLRNPFRWSFDRLTQDMWIGDVGQDAWEEVNFRTAGNTGNINYGWRCYEGLHAYNTTGCNVAGNYVSPVFEYSHDNTTGGSSITGGYVYRGSAYPTLVGYYIMADYVSGNCWLIKSDGLGGFTSTRQAALPGNIVGFGEDMNGELYAVSLPGNLYRVEVLSALPLKLLAFSVKEETGLQVVSWQTAVEHDLDHFDIEYSSDGTRFEKVGTVQAFNSALLKNYSFNAGIPPHEKAYYRLKMAFKDGRSEYSAIIQTSVTGSPAVSVSPSLITNHRITITVNKPFKSVQVIDMNGRVMKSRNLGQSIGVFQFDLSDLPKGVYTIRLTGDNSSAYRRIVIQ